MESLLASSDDHLLPMASYKMGPTASYVESRQESTWFSSVSSASPEGVRVMTVGNRPPSYIIMRRQLCNKISSSWHHPRTALLLSNIDSCLPSGALRLCTFHHAAFPPSHSLVAGSGLIRTASTQRLQALLSRSRQTSALPRRSDFKLC